MKVSGEEVRCLYCSGELSLLPHQDSLPVERTGGKGVLGRQSPWGHKLSRSSEAWSPAARQAWHRSTDSLEQMYPCELSMLLHSSLEMSKICPSSTSTILQLRQTETWWSFTFTEALPCRLCLLLCELKVDVQEKAQKKKEVFCLLNCI